MADLDRVKRNIGRMISLNAPEADIDAYIASEGTSVDEVRSFKPAEAAKPEVSRMESLGRGALQGGSFGFSDEIYGAGAGVVDKLFGSGDFGGTYERERDAVRAANKTAREANPGSYLAGEIGGGIALPLGAARVGAQTAMRGAQTLGQRAASGARVGVPVGGAYGLGTAEGDASTQALETAKGALIGGVTGAVAAPVIDGLSAVGRAVAQPIAARLDPKGTAATKVVEALDRDQKGGRLANRISSSAASDADTMILDVGGTSTQRLARAAQNQQNPQNERFRLALDARKAFEGDKIERGLRRGLDLSPQDFYSSVYDVAARLKNIGDEAFKPVLAIETPMTPKLAAVLERPTARRVLEHVEARLQDEGKAVGFATRTEALHRVKIELNKLISSATQAQKMGQANGWDVNSLRTIRRDLLDAWDNKAYRAASQKYADEAALRTAAQSGYDDFLAMPAQELRKAMAGMSEAERSMFRKGAVQAVSEKIGAGNPMNDKVRGALSSDNMQGRLRVLFNDDRRAWREFQKLQVVLSRQSKSRAAAQGNSTTAQQLSDGQDATQVAGAVKTAADAATGNWRALLDGASRVASRAAGMTPEVAAETLRVLGSRPARSGGGMAGLSGPSTVYSPALRQAMERAALGQQRRNATLEGGLFGSLGVLNEAF